VRFELFQVAVNIDDVMLYMKASPGAAADEEPTAAVLKSLVGP
jgi:hypothetical protein